MQTILYKIVNLQSLNNNTDIKLKDNNDFI